MLAKRELLCGTYLGPWSPSSKSQIGPFPVFLRIDVTIRDYF